MKSTVLNVFFHITSRMCYTIRHIYDAVISPLHNNVYWIAVNRKQKGFDNTFACQKQHMLAMAFFLLHINMTGPP